MKKSNEFEVSLQTNEYQLKQLDEMKANLPRYLRDREKEFAKKLKNYIDLNSFEGQYVPDNNKIPLQSVTEYVFKPIIKTSGALYPNYSANEMAVAFDFYVKCSNKLNETSVYIPKIQDFCRLLNIPVKKFRDYQKNSTDESMRNLCEMVQDYCVARTADGALLGIIDKVYSMFHQKSSNEQRDNEPIQNNILVQNNTIMSEEQFKELQSKLSNDY